MKFFGKDVKQVDRGFFGIRRCTICDEALRDVNLVELWVTTNIFFVPIKSSCEKRLLVCQKCDACMEINDDLWEYYQTYLNRRFNKATTHEIVGTLTQLDNQMRDKGVNLSIDDKSMEASINLIYNSLVEKYKTWQNVEEIVSVFYK